MGSPVNSFENRSAHEAKSLPSDKINQISHFVQPIDHRSTPETSMTEPAYAWFTAQLTSTPTKF